MEPGQGGHGHQDATGRRDVLKKIGVGGAVAWTLPTLVSSPARAAASGGVPPVPCPLCGLNLITNPQADGSGGPPPPGSAAGWTSTIGGPPGFPFGASQYGGALPGGPFAPVGGPDLPNLFAIGAWSVAGSITTTVDLPVACRSVQNSLTVLFNVALQSQSPSPPSFIGTASLRFFDGPGGTGTQVGLSQTTFPSIQNVGPAVPLSPLGLPGPAALPAGAVSFTFGFDLLADNGSHLFGFDNIRAFLTCGP